VSAHDGKTVHAFKVLSLFVFLTFELLNFLNLEPLFAQASIYQGKTLKVIVGSAPGGGYDLWARLMAQHIGRHIPGHPTVIVQNMPGAGGVIAANFVYGLVKPDGLTIGAFNPALYFEQLVARPETKFDWTQFTWIGSPEKNDVVHFIRADSPFKSIDDLRNAKEPPKCGSTGPGTTAHYFPRLLEDTLGIKTTVVTGYQGGSEIDLAIERNEVSPTKPIRLFQQPVRLSFELRTMLLYPRDHGRQGDVEATKSALYSCRVLVNGAQFERKTRVCFWRNLCDGWRFGQAC